MTQIQKIRADFPKKLAFLFQPKRYKVAYGGRGGAKSWGYARALLIKGAEQPLRIWCCREIQKTIRDSVHRLLKDQIKALGFEDFYTVTQESIKGKNGTEFTFSGLHLNTELKSHEGDDIAWVEEAQFVSKSSWTLLIPTIRRPGSEIWITFNPELEDDETYKRFVVSPPTDSVVVKIGYQDNPWFPDVLERERVELKSKDEEAYFNVWEGQCRQLLEGGIFTKQLRQAYTENRITRVPYDPSAAVDTYWDLGWADFTSIWFVQPLPLEFRIIRFYQNHLQDVNHYLNYIQSLGYTLREIYLPHDGKAQLLASGGRSISSIMTGKGFSVTCIDRITEKITGINAARAVIPLCYFDEKNCADGMLALKRYRFEYDQDTGKYSDKPAHDWASHGADAFIQFGMKARLEPTVADMRSQKEHVHYDPWKRLEQMRA